LKTKLYFLYHAHSTRLTVCT